MIWLNISFIWLVILNALFVIFVHCYIKWPQNLQVKTLLQMYYRITCRIDKINNIAKYNLIDTNYHQIAFWLARWLCSRTLSGNLWSNKSEWWPPEGDNLWNFSSQINSWKRGNLLLISKRFCTLKSISYNLNSKLPLSQGF